MNWQETNVRWMDARNAVAVEKHTKKKALWPNWKPHVQPANSKLSVWRLKIQANVRKLSC